MWCSKDEMHLSAFSFGSANWTSADPHLTEHSTSSPTRLFATVSLPDGRSVDYEHPAPSCTARTRTANRSFHRRQHVRPLSTAWAAPRSPPRAAEPRSASGRCCNQPRSSLPSHRRRLPSAPFSPFLHVINVLPSASAGGSRWGNPAASHSQRAGPSIPPLKCRAQIS